MRIKEKKKIYCARNQLILHFFFLPKVIQHWVFFSVSGRHSWKCVTLLILRTELKIYLITFWTHILGHLFFNNFKLPYILSLCFWPNPKRRASTDYQLSADIHCHTNFPYTLCDKDFEKINFWFCAAVVSHSQLLSKWLGKPSNKKAD